MSFSGTNPYSGTLPRYRQCLFSVISLSYSAKESYLSHTSVGIINGKYARKIFGNENPIGKILRYSNGKDITIEGIVGEPECKTTINFDIILSF